MIFFLINFEFIVDANHAITDHDTQPQTVMDVFRSKACRFVWNSIRSEKES